MTRPGLWPRSCHVHADMPVGLRQQYHRGSGVSQNAENIGIGKRTHAGKNGARDTQSPVEGCMWLATVCTIWLEWEPPPGTVSSS